MFLKLGFRWAAVSAAALADLADSFTGTQIIKRSCAVVPRAIRII